MVAKTTFLPEFSFLCACRLVCDYLQKISFIYAYDCYLYSFGKLLKNHRKKSED